MRIPARDALSTAYTDNNIHLNIYEYIHACICMLYVYYAYTKMQEAMRVGSCLFGSLELCMYMYVFVCCM